MRCLLFFILLGFLGCATSTQNYSEIWSRVKSIDVSDGVEKQEAVLIALRHAINKGYIDRLYDFNPIKVEKRYLWYKGDEIIYLIGPPTKGFQFQIEERWKVFFKDREHTYLFGAYPVVPFYVEINGKTGDVLNWGLDKRNNKESYF